jgi:hypothetical protein
VGRWGYVALCALGTFVLVSPASAARVAVRDDTASLQAQLDFGGSVFLPKLPGGRCYATRGLWVSRDNTTISSDGACIVALGPGEARLPGTPHPVRANAVFFLTHSDLRQPPPVRVTISGLHIVVPAAVHMAGVAIFGHETTIDHVAITGEPTTDVVVGDGARGAAGPIERNAILNSTLSGGRRDVVSAFGPIGLRIEGNTLTDARNAVAAGVHIRAADRGAPTLDVHVVGNTIADNAGPGIFLDLDPTNGAPILATGIEVRGNRVLHNARRAPAFRRGGIVVAGGEGDGKGSVTVAANVVAANGGPALLGRRLHSPLTLQGNALRGNGGGETKGLRPVAAMPATRRDRWEPAASTLAAAGRDDTSWLQARLDAGGGTIFLPKLPNGVCYATRGLWVSHDDTTITSDGACIDSLGPGPVRLRSTDGDPIASTAVLTINRSNQKRPGVTGVTISGLRIVVPAHEGMFGIAAFGHHTTLSDVEIEGSPIDDVLIGGRGNGNGYVAHVSVLDSTLSGATRNAISAFGVIGLRIEGDTIQGVHDSPPGQPAAGIDVEPDDRGQPTLDVQIRDDVISDNAGPGILLPLETNYGPAMIASDLALVGNTIVRNAHGRTPPTRAGVAIEGGQDGGEGTLLLQDNVIHDNGGPGILFRFLALAVEQSGNDLRGNEGG